MTEKEELEYYRNLASDLNRDPDIALEWNKVLKKARPNASTPQLDFLEKSDQKLKTEFEARDKKIDELSKQLLEKQVADKLDRERSVLRGGKYNFGDSEITEVEKLITEKGFPSYETAADYYLVLHQPAPANRFTGLRTRPKEEEPSKLQKTNEAARKIFKKRTRDDGAFDKAYEEAIHLFDK